MQLYRLQGCFLKFAVPGRSGVIWTPTLGLGEDNGATQLQWAIMVGPVGRTSVDEIVRFDGTPESERYALLEQIVALEKCD